MWALRTSTHVVFGSGLAGAAAAALGCGAVCVVASALLAGVINALIDAGGHERRGGMVYRTKLTHSLETVAPLSFAAGLLVALSLGLPLTESLGAGLATAVGGLSHLALDALTPGGVYFRGRRVRLPLFNWDSPEPNLAFTVAGVLLLGYSIAAVSRGLEVVGGVS